MASPLSDPHGAASPVLSPRSTNNESTTSRFQRLSLSTASTTALPPSPQISSPRRASMQRTHPPSPGGNQLPRSPLPRSPSSMSIDARSSSPTLHRKASMNSLHGVGGVTPPRGPQSRRSSSAHLFNGQAPPFMAKSPLSGVEDAPSAPLPPTAESIASAHFKSELDIHKEEMEGRPADTVVILHDSCYGHRFSRPGTSKGDLANIVERPERISASILGLSVAYVMLGQRHAEGRYPPHPKRDASHIPNIPFRIQKTTRALPLSSPAVTNVHGGKWMEELIVMCDGAEAKLAMNGKELTRPEMNRSSSQEAPPKLHEGDLYLCSESLNAMEGALGAVCEGVDAVFHGSTSGKGPHRAFVAIRPPGHHCSASYPSGFCWLNNVHVGISHAMLTHGLTHAAIIDFDLHHGDGSQTITWEHNKRVLNLPKNAPSWKKTSIGYFSLHDINSYPCEYGDEEKTKNASLCIENAHGQTIWNVHLQPWKSEQEFWELYESRYAILLDKAKAYLCAQAERLRMLPNPVSPKGAIFFSAGFDASEWETSEMQRHKVNVPTEFYARLARDVVKMATEEDCAVQGRVISVLEGGYSNRALSSGVLSHISGLAGGDPINTKREDKHNGLGYEMARKFGSLNGVSGANYEAGMEPLIEPYDTAWWSLSKLEQLDSIVAPPTPPAELKKPRDTAPPTYSSPTQSFTAKIVSTPRLQRSVSNLSGLNGGSPRAASRPPSPPPPEVYWTTAAHELSKLLIPSDRPTTSCKPEELSTAATRARRDRQSILTTLAPSIEAVSSAMPTVRMSLRERKATKPLTMVEDEETAKPVSRTGRRKTVAGGTVLAAEKVTAQSSSPKQEASFKKPTKQSAIRLSLSSSGRSAASHDPSHQMSNGQNGGAAPGVSTAVSQRPGSSQSVRPGSSLSSRGQPIAPVVVKKTRPAGSARTEITKSSRTSRKTPTDGSSSNFGRDGARDIQPASRAPSSSRTVTAAAVPRTSGAASSADVDSITTGMKKVTINLTTKAQREAREQAQQAATAASSRVPNGSITQQVRGAVNSSEAAPQLQNQPMSSLEPRIQATFSRQSEVKDSSPIILPLTPQLLPPSRFAHLQDASNVPLPASSPIPNSPKSEAATRNDVSAVYSNKTSDVFVPYQPEGPMPAHILQQEPLTWLPPNSSTPAAMKRSDLPVFTSTSAIPFSTNMNGVSNVAPASGSGSVDGVKQDAVKVEK